jgi:hypothetical protein
MALVFKLVLLAERLIPFAERLLDAYQKHREEARAAAEKKAKDDRNDAAIKAANEK